MPSAFPAPENTPKRIEPVVEIETVGTRQTHSILPAGLFNLSTGIQKRKYKLTLWNLRYGDEEITKRSENLRYQTLGNLFQYFGFVRVI